MKRVYAIINPIGEMYITANHCKTVEELQEVVNEVVFIGYRKESELCIITTRMNCLTIKIKEADVLSDYIRIEYNYNNEYKYEVISYDLPIVLEITETGCKVMDNENLILEILESLYKNKDKIKNVKYI